MRLDIEHSSPKRRISRKANIKNHQDMKKPTQPTQRDDIKQPKRQHCPACNRYVRVSSRYPDYAGDKCRQLAVNKHGAPVEFFNKTFDGHGCQGIVIQEVRLTRSNTCFIKGMRFRVEEAYLGGVVFLPFPQPQRNSVKRKR